MTLKNPADGIEDNLVDVDARMKAVTGTNPAAYVQAEMAAAQVQATCALVHAVRELTAEVRKLNRQETVDA